jgi:hypothetical protein
VTSTGKNLSQGSHRTLFAIYNYGPWNNPQLGRVQSVGADGRPLDSPAYPTSCSR